MSEQRRGAVMLIQRGDPEISGALMAGVMAGRAEAAERGTTSSVTARSAVTPSPQGIARAPRAQAPRAPRTGWEGFWKEARPVESVEIVTVQQDKWRRVARQVRVAVGNTKTPEDYHLMIVKARSEYAIHTRPGPMHTAAGKLLLAWALLWEALRRAYRAQDWVLKP